MCGIIGITANASQDVVQDIMAGLKRVEYRGYDSAGIAVLTPQGIETCRAIGKLCNLEHEYQKSPLHGSTAIGHTRWATHGVPSLENTHPHFNDKIAVVHNGIIENYVLLKEELQRKGYTFNSETDTEVMVHLLTDLLKEGHTLFAAIPLMVQKLQGAFALAILCSDYPDQLFGVRRSSPLAIGYGDNFFCLGSDALAMSHLTNRVSYLEEGDWVHLTPTHSTIYDAHNTVVNRPLRQINHQASVGKGSYRHFMLKEIFEQPQVISQTLQGFLAVPSYTLDIPELPCDPTTLEHLTMVACGTSYYAAMVGKYWFEKFAHLPVSIDIASEFRYRTPPFSSKGVSLFISQSGETADTLAAAEMCRHHYQTVLSIVNVADSSLVRASDASFLTQAGVEIGVASTKAFTAQLTVLATLALVFGEMRGILTKDKQNELLDALSQAPGYIATILQQTEMYEEIGHYLAKKTNALYIGRGTNYPIALEGALKLKELSYIHAEGYAAGELKHGPIALIDQEMPIIVIAPYDEWFEKTVSNVQEVIARGGTVIVLSNKSALVPNVARGIPLPTVNPFIAPIVYTIPIQLLAYYTAIAKGTDVDQPRNLAKSVTVE